MYTSLPMTGISTLIYLAVGAGSIAVGGMGVLASLFRRRR